MLRLFLHTLTLAALLAIPTAAISQTDNSPSTTGDKVAAFLKLNGGEGTTYPIRRSKEAKALQKVIRLKKPVEASDLTALFGEPDAIEQEQHAWIGSRRGKAAQEPGGEIWQYGRIGVFVRDNQAQEYAEFALENPDARPNARTSRSTARAKANTEIPLPAKWPKYSQELLGPFEVRVNNPNPFAVRVGLRAGYGGKNFAVPPNGVMSVGMPPGQYEVYFQYSNDPESLYRGDSFTLVNNGVEISIVKIVDGNYQIRKVE